MLDVGSVDLGDGTAALEIASDALGPRSPVAAKSLASSLVILGSPGAVYACAGTLDASALTATYYVQIVDSSAAVDGGGAITCIAPPIRIAHTSGTDDYFSFGVFFPIGGLSCSAGAVVQLSSTLGTGTLAGAYMLAGGAR